MAGEFFDQVRLSFSQIRMQGRFLDRQVADSLNPIVRKFFMRAGGAIRTTARRQLRKAPRAKFSDLGRIEQTNYLTAKMLYQKGRRTQNRNLKKGVWNAGALPAKPQLPDATSKPGSSPFLHVTWDAGTSPLKHRLWFALTDDKTSVLIGPAAIGRNRRVVRSGGITTLRELERRHPFMEPAYKIIEPKLPEYLRTAAGL
jgi:hypothetical protein